jgi:histidinol phosphatase-like enzyme
MKIVFLDIDGVLNSEDFTTANPPDHSIHMRLDA